MAKDEAAGAGAIYRYYRELRKLYSDISIPNAICFPPSGAGAFHRYRDAKGDEGQP